MTTQDNTEETTEGGGLRKQLEAALAKNKVHEARERSAAFTDAGFDTSKGLGKAISQVYEGDVTADAILKFAADEYEYAPTPSDAPQVHPQAAQIAIGQHQLDQVGNVAGSVTQVTQTEQLAAARAAGDYDTIGAIQAAQMQAMMDRQNQSI